MFQFMDKWLDNQNKQQSMFIQYLQSLKTDVNSNQVNQANQSNQSNQINLQQKYLNDKLLENSFIKSEKEDNSWYMYFSVILFIVIFILILICLCFVIVIYTKIGIYFINTIINVIYNRYGTYRACINTSLGIR